MVAEGELWATLSECKRRPWERQLNRRPPEPQVVPDMPKN